MIPVERLGWTIRADNLGADHPSGWSVEPLETKPNRFQLWTPPIESEGGLRFPMFKGEFDWDEPEKAITVWVNSTSLGRRTVHALSAYQREDHA